MADIKLPKRYLIQCTTKSFFSLKEWLTANYDGLTVDWGNIKGEPEDNANLVDYIDQKVTEICKPDRLLFNIPFDVNETEIPSIPLQDNLTISSIDDGGLNDIVIEVNDIVVTLPFPLNNGDKLNIKHTVDGVVDRILILIAQ
jgi:hypothetical protein